MTERGAERSPLVCPAETRVAPGGGPVQSQNQCHWHTLLFSLGAPDHQPVGTTVGSSPEPGFPTALKAAIFLAYLPLSSPET